MPGIHITQFGGEVPAISPKLLDRKFATVAINCDLRTGKLRTWPAPVVVGQAPGIHIDIGIHPFYPPLTALGNRNGWLDPPWQDFQLESWEGTAAAAYGTPALPYRNQPQGRVYFWREGEPRPMCRQINSNQYVPVGVTTGPLVSSVIVSGVEIAGGIPFATAYCATYVDIYGSEGAPGVPTVVPNRLNGQTVSMVISETRADHTVGIVRLYRAVSDFTSGEEVTNVMDTSWHLVAEIPGPASGTFTITYADTLLDHQIAGDTLLSREYFSPPAAPIAALCRLQGGWLAWVYRDGRVAISQRHQWQAYPGRNIRQLPSNQVVDAAAHGDTIIVSFVDRGNIRLSVRADGAGIATAMDEYAEEFTGIDNPLFLGGHNRTLVKAPFGAIFGSPEGLVSLGVDGAISNSTKGLVLPNQFRNPRNVLLSNNDLFYPGFFPGTAIWHKGFYLTSVASGVTYSYAMYDLPDQISGSFADAALTHLDFSAYATGSTDAPGICFVSDRDRITFIIGGTVYQWDGLDASVLAPVDNRLNYTWRSAVFVMPQLTEFSAVKVTGLFIPGDVNARIRIWCDTRLVIDRDVALSDIARETIFRLPAGFKGINFQFELVGNADIDEVHIATSVKELSEP